MRNQRERINVTLKIYNEEGREFDVKCSYEEVCVQAGTYSQLAVDPEEYYGIYEPDLTTLDIDYAESDEYDEQIDNEDYILYEGEDIPLWVYEQTASEIKEKY